MEKIIKKAIEGGYELEGYDLSRWNKGTSLSLPELDRLVVCDPLFWQALSKTCEWGSTGLTKSCLEKLCNDGMEIREIMVWEMYALRFHEINLTQGFEKSVEWLSNLIQEK